MKPEATYKEENERLRTELKELRIQYISIAAESIKRSSEVEELMTLVNKLINNQK